MTLPSTPACLYALTAQFVRAARADYEVTDAFRLICYVIIQCSGQIQVKPKSTHHPMSKSNQRQKHITAPNSAQIDAVRRLIDGGDTVQARKRLDALRKSYPDFKPLLKLAWDIEDSGGHPVFATARAYEWHRAAPRSGVALRALSESSLSAGYSAICACALQRLSAIENEQDDLKIPQSFDSELGTMSLEQAEAIDLSRMHLADGNSAAAIAVLKNVVVSHVDIQGRAGYEIHAKVVQTQCVSPADVAGLRPFHTHHHF